MRARKPGGPPRVNVACPGGRLWLDAISKRGPGLPLPDFSFSIPDKTFYLFSFLSKKSVDEIFLLGIMGASGQPTDISQRSARP
jgi:hypothetical protein